MSSRFWKENGLFLAWMVAVTATLGSLYFSEIMQYIPCKLCWFQRIFMYPLVIILGIATLKRDLRITAYVLPLSVIGGLFSLFHVIYERTDWFHGTVNFCGENPCDFRYINWFGFITIPLLALVAFVLITLACVLVRKADRDWSF